MKFYLSVFVLCVCASVSYADNQPTPANQPTIAPTADNTQSVLDKSAQSNQPQTSNQQQPQNCCNVTDKKIVYKNKRNIAPCAVEQGLNLSYCETGVDACCNKVSRLENIDVPACVPPCACKDNVTVSRDGKKVVHDYGRYEVVLRARRDGAVEVNYRKRLFDR